MASHIATLAKLYLDGEPAEITEQPIEHLDTSHENAAFYCNCLP